MSAEPSDLERLLIIAATSADFRQMIREGRIKEALDSVGIEPTEARCQAIQAIDKDRLSALARSFGIDAAAN